MASDPITQFRSWFQQALDAGLTEPSAMTLATADAAGQPSARTVLLKNVDERGFSFFTNYESRKGSELSANARAALVLYWAELERQVCIAGTVSKLSRAESEAYFKTRPRGSRLAAWISRQSQPVANRAELEDKMKQIEAQYPGEDIPLPPFWGGYVLRPHRIEFWHGRPSRLHDRFSYSRQPNGQWRLDRLSP
jgi:pyridoxamine 5'-phosphate oxidase